VYCNLAEAGLYGIGELEMNPELYGWIADANWVYRKRFDCPSDLLDQGRIDLVFAGLDTVSRIWLNGELLGETENMFIAHRFDAKTLLKPENNELVVAFEPVGEYGERIRDEHLNEEIKTRRSYIRKGQYVYGWDWCPPLPGCGIWRTVSLEGISMARIDNVYVQTLEIGDGWADLKLEVELDKVADGDFVCDYEVLGEGETTGRLEFSKGQGKAEAVVRIENPPLWWPIGYGEANLHTLEVSLAQNGELLDKVSERFGIRTVELDTAPDEHGHKYQLIVNGQPVYIKGANWVPATMFPGSLKEIDYRGLIEAAVDVNMNIGVSLSLD
jgi:beta-mannosidase